MKAKVNDLSERLLKFSISVIQYLKTLPKDSEFKIIRYQLIKSATSTGANYSEAQSAISRAEFKYKVSIALKEMSETKYWLTLIESLIQTSQSKIDSLLKEAVELENILAAIVKKIG